MIVVDQVLVIGVTVAGLDMTVDDAELIINRFENRHNGIGRTAGGREDLLAGLDIMIIDAIDNIGDIALAGGGQQNLRCAFRFQVQAQAFTITPFSGVVDDDGVVDVILGVVDLVRSIGIDDADHIAVGNDGILFFVDFDRSFKVTVNGITTQQAGSAEQIIITALAHDGRTQAQLVAAACLIDQDPRQ